MPALADVFSLKFVWQQVSSSVQDSSQYSGRSLKCYTLNDSHSSSYFQVLQSPYESFSECTECTNYNVYDRHCYVPKFFSDL